MSSPWRQIFPSFRSTAHVRYRRRTDQLDLHRLAQSCPSQLRGPACLPSRSLRPATAAAASNYSRAPACSPGLRDTRALPHRATAPVPSPVRPPSPPPHRSSALHPASKTGQRAASSRSPAPPGTASGPRSRSVSIPYSCCFLPDPPLPADTVQPLEPPPSPLRTLPLYAHSPSRASLASFQICRL